MSVLHLRSASPDDAPAIAAIYNAGIRGRRATFETAERSALDVAAWFVRPAELPAACRHPFVVAERGTTVVGWARASIYRSRAAYLRIAEYSVYVAPSAQGQGIGHALMGSLVSECATSGLTKLVARIFPENTASIALAVRHGFRIVGTYEQHGQLDGHWRDVVIVERLLPAPLP